MRTQMTKYWGLLLGALILACGPVDPGDNPDGGRPDGDKAGTITNFRVVTEHPTSEVELDWEIDGNADEYYVNCWIGDNTTNIQSFTVTETHIKMTVVTNTPVYNASVTPRYKGKWGKKTNLTPPFQTYATVAEKNVERMKLLFNTKTSNPNTAWLVDDPNGNLDQSNYGESEILPSSSCPTGWEVKFEWSWAESYRCIDPMTLNDWYEEGDYRSDGKPIFCYLEGMRDYGQEIYDWAASLGHPQGCLNTWDRPFTQGGVMWVLESTTTQSGVTTDGRIGMVRRAQ